MCGKANILSQMLALLLKVAKDLPGASSPYIRHKKIAVFPLTCWGKNWSVGRRGETFFFFFFYFFSPEKNMVGPVIL